MDKIKKIAKNEFMTFEEKESLTEILNRNQPIKPLISAYFSTICPSCRHEIKEDYEFCPHCGQRIERC